MRCVRSRWLTRGQRRRPAPAGPVVRRRIRPPAAVRSYRVRCAGSRRRQPTAAGRSPPPTDCLHDHTISARSRSSYASPAWSGFITATDRQRVDALLSRSKRRGFCPPNMPDFDQLLESDMELGHLVTGSMGHLGHLSRPGHRVIILTRCET